MSAQAKTINLLLHDGSLQGVVCIEDSGWYSGEMYSAPRESMDELLKTDACSKYGVYLLLSRNRVYVGQSSDLARRLAQHVTGKDWWTSAVVLTTKDNSLGHSDIDWLESTLIEKARFVGRLDCDNLQRGNPVKVDRFREVWLSQYLDEALFLMEFIGIPVFVERRSLDRSSTATHIDLTDVHNLLAVGTRTKRLAIDYVTEHGVDINANATYAVLNKAGTEFFLNPRTTKLDSNWSIVLNDTLKRMLLVMMVPTGSLHMCSDGITGLVARKDKPEYIDLHLTVEYLRDRISGTDFSSYLIGRIAY